MSIIDKRIAKAQSLLPIVNRIRVMVDDNCLDSLDKYNHYLQGIDNCDIDNIPAIHLRQESFKIFVHPKDGIDEAAERETIAIKGSFKPHTIDFGKRKHSSMKMGCLGDTPKTINHRYIWKKVTL